MEQDVAILPSHLLPGLLYAIDLKNKVHLANCVVLTW
jgi:hypothetical protein